MRTDGLMAQHCNRAQMLSHTGEFIRTIGIREADELVTSGMARRRAARSGMAAIQLFVLRRPDRAKNETSISYSEMVGNAEGQRRPRLKLLWWPVIGDRQAVRVCVRTA
jgi:hypothetical protein